MHAGDARTHLAARRVVPVDALTRLARAAQHGDERALEAFVEVSYDQVWRLCAGLVSASDADDLSQETYARALRALPQFRADASARTWLLAIARYVCLDELRSKDRRRRRDASAALRAGGRRSAAGDASESIVVNDLLGRLDPDRRSAFVLTQMLGLSYEEAARVCGCPIGTIRSRVARARMDLLSTTSDAVERPEQRAH